MNEIQLEQMTALMQSAADALANDGEWDAPIYENGEVVGYSGANPFEAVHALNAVASILGIPGPSDL